LWIENKWVTMVLSLVELCVRSAIDNLSHLGDVGHTDMSLLEVILPHCDADQLLHIESSTEVRLSLSLSLSGLVVARCGVLVFCVVWEHMYALWKRSHGAPDFVVVYCSAIS